MTGIKIGFAFVFTDHAPRVTQIKAGPLPAGDPACVAGKDATMTAGDDIFGMELTRAMPMLRRHARSLARHTADTEDLVQDTLLKAWAHRGGFTPRTNLSAWLCCIQRNAFYSRRRTAGRETCEAAPEQPGPEDTQLWRLAAKEVQSFVDGMSPNHRFALLEIGGGGLSHGEAVQRRPKALGTSKSALFRARARLKARFDPEVMFG